ncbi:MAG TPA: hypothetical protein VMB52_02790 [Verrucomicrobiae bacterium]|nr:hypothetical protein [Verrucomicrobiae bacterium]
MERQVGEKRTWCKRQRLVATRLFYNGRFNSVLLFLPAFGVLLLILGFGQNVPFWDEWELVPIFQHLHAGHFYWHDFWQQHNEHRIVLPTLILVGLAYLTHWNIQTECVLSLLVATASFWILRDTILMTFGSGKHRMTFYLLLLIALIWFSPVQVENWLWGWQLEWFLNVLGVVLVIYGVAKLLRGATTIQYLPIILCGGVMAQYSLGNGTLIWPLIVLTLWYIRVSIWQTFSVLTVGSITTALYYVHYASVGTDVVSRRLAEAHPLTWSRYVLMYLGRPVSFLSKPASLLGFVLAATFLALAVYLLSRKRELFRQGLPWLILGSYTLGSALITGIARLDFGVSEALSSRYTTISSLLLISLILLGWLARSSICSWLGKYNKMGLIAIVVGLYGLVLINVGWGLHAAREQHSKLVAIHVCTKAPDPSDTCVLTTYPDSSIVKPRIQYLKSIHWGGY